MKINQAEKPLHKTTLNEDREKQAAQTTQLALKEMQRKYQKMLAQLNIADRLVDMANEYVTAFPAAKSKPRQFKKSGSGSTESAVLVLSDTHIGKKVYRSQTLGFGNYNFNIFADRLYFLEDRVRSILNEHVTSPVDELVIFLLGDMLDGSLNHAKEVVSAMTVFDQFYAGAHCLSQAIRNMAQDVARVKVYTAVGNHTRMQNQHKMPTEQRYSNFDHFLYATIKAMLANQSNVDVRLDYQPFCYTDIKGTKIMAMHGDHLKGGDKQMGIPVHSISRQVSGLTQLYESKGLEAPHLWLSGHLHRPMELPTIKGEWIVNGAFPGDDNYALTLASSSEPMQLFFGIHPKYRKTWEYKIKLAHAPQRTALPYELPKELKEMIVT